ncbi:unnamed protein product [Phytophthora fragariaefolia]|uniref:Unnamed protein product n=1 Tax=Phytophthora fragariaefolia TaxID=1490495 RepID=A0A9W7CYI7_9STRA|nr:unnamed protein product [Phytophthora fragariaefolia]
MSVLTVVQLASLMCTSVEAWNAVYGNVTLGSDQNMAFLGTGVISTMALQLTKTQSDVVLGGVCSVVTGSQQLRVIDSVSPRNSFSHGAQVVRARVRAEAFTYYKISIKSEET